MTHDNGAYVKRPLCGYTTPMHPGLVCGREAGHTGIHIEFRENLSIGFGRVEGDADANAR